MSRQNLSHDETHNLPTQNASPFVIDLGSVCYTLYTCEPLESTATEIVREGKDTRIFCLRIRNKTNKTRKSRNKLWPTKQHPLYFVDDYIHGSCEHYMYGVLQPKLFKEIYKFGEKETTQGKITFEDLIKNLQSVEWSYEKEWGEIITKVYKGRELFKRFRKAEYSIGKWIEYYQKFPDLVPRSAQDEKDANNNQPCQEEKDAKNKYPNTLILPIYVPKKEKKRKRNPSIKKNIKHPRIALDCDDSSFQDKSNNLLPAEQTISDIKIMSPHVSLSICNSRNPLYLQQAQPVPNSSSKNRMIYSDLTEQDFFPRDSIGNIPPVSTENSQDIIENELDDDQQNIRSLENNYCLFHSTDHDENVNNDSGLDRQFF